MREATNWELFLFCSGLVIATGGVLLLSAWQVGAGWIAWGAGVVTLSLGFVFMDRSKVMEVDDAV